tara:strand:- start:3761 stop:4093 length:333 start_codon:yes stop_codon:yes gene_type:complete
VQSALVIGGITIFILYLLYQGRFIIAGPIIELYNEPTSTVVEIPILIQGNVQNSSYLELNGRPLTTTKDGDFKEPVYLQTGYNIVTILAKDRFGRKKSEVRGYVYIPNNN